MLRLHGCVTGCLIEPPSTASVECVRGPMRMHALYHNQLKSRRQWPL